MKKYGIFYGSQTGTTASVAKRIAEQLGVDEADVHDVAQTAPSAVADYEELIMGTSTWGDGEIEDDWYDFLDGIQAFDLKGKRLAVFGCGDEGMTRTFCNGVGELYRRMIKTGITPIGVFNADGYEFEHSEAFINGEFVGLVLDEVNKPELTDRRIKEWVELIR